MELTDGAELVGSARMPLLKLTLRGGGPLAKLTLSPLPRAAIPAVRTAAVVAAHLERLPHARPLLLLLKALMRPPNALSNFVGVLAGGISSFTATLLALAFCKYQAQARALALLLRHSRRSASPGCNEKTTNLAVPSLLLRLFRRVRSCRGPPAAAPGRTCPGLSSVLR